jgi:hypothetical protein
MSKLIEYNNPEKQIGLQVSNTIFYIGFEDRIVSFH